VRRGPNVRKAHLCCNHPVGYAWYIELISGDSGALHRAWAGIQTKRKISSFCSRCPGESRDPWLSFLKLFQHYGTLPALTGSCAGKDGPRLFAGKRSELVAEGFLPNLIAMTRQTGAGCLGDSEVAKERVQQSLRGQRVKAHVSIAGREPLKCARRSPGPACRRGPGATDGDSEFEEKLRDVKSGSPQPL
jgi:hypothetical protein